MGEDTVRQRKVGGGDAGVAGDDQPRKGVTVAYHSACSMQHGQQIKAAPKLLLEAAGFAVITNFVGHGVGKSLHEEPQIPNFGRKGSGPKLKKGMAVCIEPMVNMKSPKVRMATDGWTALAVDGLPSAHFEHTLLVDEGDAEILTIPEGFEKAEPFFAREVAVA